VGQHIRISLFERRRAYSYCGLLGKRNPPQCTCCAMAWEPWLTVSWITITHAKWWRNGPKKHFFSLAGARGPTCQMGQWEIPGTILILYGMSHTINLGCPKAGQ
jgi:hypothetical protein